MFRSWLRPDRSHLRHRVRIGFALDEAADPGQPSRVIGWVRVGGGLARSPGLPALAPGGFVLLDNGCVLTLLF